MKKTINVDEAKIMTYYTVVDQGNMSYGEVLVIKHQPNGDIFVIENNVRLWPTLGYLELFPYRHSAWSGLIKINKKKRDILLYKFFNSLFGNDSNFYAIKEKVEIYL